VLLDGHYHYVQLLKSGKTKTCKIWSILVQLLTYREYLRNQHRYQKLETNLIDGNPWGVQQKICEFWSANEKVIGVDVPTLSRQCGMLMHLS